MSGERILYVSNYSSSFTSYEWPPYGLLLVDPELEIKEVSYKLFNSAESKCKPPSTNCDSQMNVKA